MKIPERKNPNTPAKPAGKNIHTIRNKALLPPQTKGMAERRAGDTFNSDDIIAGAVARRSIDATTIAGIAKLVAKNLTESEACRRLGIQPRVWFNFKDRAGRGEKFAALLEAYRAHRIEHLIERIEKSADGVDVKFPDFRAALALLKITDQKRFGDSPTVEVHQPAVINVAIMADALKQAYERQEIADVAALPAIKPALPFNSRVAEKNVPGAGQTEAIEIKALSAPPTRIPVRAVVPAPKQLENEK